MSGQDFCGEMKHSSGWLFPWKCNTLASERMLLLPMKVFLSKAVVVQQHFV